jgi:hypothetical protein
MAIRRPQEGQRDNNRIGNLDRRHFIMRYFTIKLTINLIQDQWRWIDVLFSAILADIGTLFSQ